MPVFTAAVAAVGAAIAAPTIATVATAVVSVGTAVATTGIGLNIIGKVTGSEDLQKIGGTMATVGGLAALAGGITGGVNSLLGNVAAGTKSYADHLATAWDDGVGKLFSSGPDVAGTGTSTATAQQGFGSPAAMTPEERVAAFKTPPVGAPGGPQGPPPIPARTPPKGILESLTTSDKLAVASAGGQALAGLGEGYFTGQAAERQAELDRERWEADRPQAVIPTDRTIRYPGWYDPPAGIIEARLPRPAARPPMAGRA